MAIDTAADRRAVSGIGSAYVGPGVTPDATPDAFWRASAAWGFLSSGPAPNGQVPAASRYWTRYTAIDRTLGT